MFFSFIFYLCIRFNHNGEMQEWLNWLAWKASISQKGIGGSNPPFSAEKGNSKGLLFCFERAGDENPRVRQRRSRLPEQESPFLREKSNPKGLLFYFERAWDENPGFANDEVACQSKNPPISAKKGLSFCWVL